MREALPSQCGPAFQNSLPGNLGAGAQGKSANTEHVCAQHTEGISHSSVTKHCFFWLVICFCIFFQM